MNQSFYERIGESVYRETLPNGLQVCVVPKPGSVSYTHLTLPTTAYV